MVWSVKLVSHGSTTARASLGRQTSTISTRSRVEDRDNMAGPSFSPSPAPAPAPAPAFCYSSSSPPKLLSPISHSAHFRPHYYSPFPFPYRFPFLHPSYLLARFSLSPLPLLYSCSLLIRVIGYVEPTDSVMDEPEFENMMIGNVISPSWMTAIEKGYKEQALQGPLTEHPVTLLQPPPPPPTLPFSSLSRLLF